MRNKLFNYTTILFVMLFFEKASILSQTLNNTGTSETHDGFFLRLQGGVGDVKTEETNILGYKLKMFGIGGIFSAKVGGIIYPNLIAFGEVGGASVANPEFKWGPASGETSDSELSMTGIGGGFSYYIMPTNIYISLSGLLSYTTLEFKDKIGESKPGLGVHLSIGKEWWISDDWAIGFALWGHKSSMNENDSEGKHEIDNQSYGLVLSATLN